MFGKRTFLIMCMLIMIGLAGCGQQNTSSDEDSGEEEVLLISAAASLTDAMEDIIDAFEEDHSGVKVTANFAGSGKLAQQIQQGAPTDVFLSADQEWMNHLEEDDLVDSDSVTDFAANELVLITKKDTDFHINSLADLQTESVKRIAIGNPDSVPAGMYTKEALKHSKLYKPLQDQFVFAKDVRQVLTYVETGNTEAGFVYRSDMLRSDDVEAAVSIDQSLYEPIVYPAATVTESAHTELAKEFVSFLESNTVSEILEDYGFNNV